MADVLEIPKRPTRNFLREDFKVTSWDVLKPHFESLLERNIDSAEALKKWFLDRSELESVIAEDLAWRYIQMTCFTENETYRKHYQDFIENIQPQIAPVSDKLNKKAADSIHLDSLSEKQGYDIMIRSLRKEIEIFREENVALFTEINTETQKYAQINGAMTVEMEGKELTLQQAAVFLMSTDRDKREEAYRKITARRLKDKDVLDELFSKLIRLRHQVAVNASFENFRDYMFKALGRFDYTPQDCFDFHDAIAHEVVPILNELSSERKKIYRTVYCQVTGEQTVPDDM